MNLYNLCPGLFQLGSWEYVLVAMWGRNGLFNSVWYWCCRHAWCCCLEDCLHCTIALSPSAIWGRLWWSASMELRVCTLVGWCSCSGWGSGGDPCFSIHCACLSELYRCYVHSMCTHPQHIYWLSWPLLSCCPHHHPMHTCVYAYLLAHTLIGYTHWRVGGGGKRGREREGRETAVLHTDTGMTIPRRHTAS